MPQTARNHPGLRYAASVPEAARGANFLLHLTVWPAYQAIDPVAPAGIVSRPVLVDARCTLGAARWRDAGWTCTSSADPP